MKRTVALLLVLLCVSFCSAAMAQSTEAPQQPDLTGGLVTSFAYERVFGTLKLESYERGNLQELHEMIAYITAALDCTVMLPDGETVSSACTARWNVDELPLDTAGIYQVTAALIPPPGSSFGEGVRREIVLPVQIVNPEGTPVLITAVDNWIPNRLAIALSLGDSPKGIVEHSDVEDTRLSATDENGAAHDIEIEWDISSVDMNTRGVYTVQGTLKPPPGLAFAPTLTLPEPVLEVSVQERGKPDINCHSRSRGALLFPWVLSPEQAAEKAFTVWMSVDGVWSRLNSECYYLQDYGLSVYLKALLPGHAHQLQVDYPGGKTGIFSFTYDGTVLDCEYAEGDRDGGDTGGNKPPTVVLPTPAPTGCQSSGESDLFEEFTETTSRIFGARLRILLESGGAVFSRQGVTITFSAAALHALSLGEAGVFLVEIQRLGDKEFSFAVSADGKSETALPGTKVVLPYRATDENAVLLLINQQGETAATGSYDKESKLCSFAVDTAGRYTILEQSVSLSLGAVPAEVQATAEPSAAPVTAVTESSPLPEALVRENQTAFVLLFTVAGCALLLGCGTFLWHRRRRR